MNCFIAQLKNEKVLRISMKKPRINEKQFPGATGWLYLHIFLVESVKTYNGM